MESGAGRIDPRSLTREEEALKRNTDCVYFLASPLTCKKGSECEYRHSEGARINPRDCKFWFSGSCLNPKCLFRHPPFDVPAGNPMAASGPIMASSLGIASTHLSSRSSVPCYYFQKGTCLKGDKCPFLHEPQPAGNPKKDAWKDNKCIPQQQIAQSKGSFVKPHNGSPSSAEVGSMAFKNASNHTVQPDRHHLKEREAGEIAEGHSELGPTKSKRPLASQLRTSSVEGAFRERSPAFDVLVDNAGRDCGGRHDEYGFRVTSHGDGFGRSADRNKLDESSEFQHHRKVQNGGGEDRYGASLSERIIDKPMPSDRRVAALRLRRPDGIDESDLRYRLMKQRRLNSSLSATVSGRETDPEKTQPSPEITVSSRLRGRITLPDSQGGGREWQRGKSSPQMMTSTLRGRVGERLGRMFVDNSLGNALNVGSQVKAVDPLGFAGPRSLAELMGSKTEEYSRGRSAKNAPFGPLESEAFAEFDGPKPLSALLKRKREAKLENDAATVQLEANSEASKAISIVGRVSEEDGEEDEEIAHNPVAAVQAVEEGDAVEDEGLNYADQRDGEYDYEPADGGYENSNLLNVDNEEEEEEEEEDEDEDDFAKKIGLIFS